MSLKCEPSKQLGVLLVDAPGAIPECELDTERDIHSVGAAGEPQTRNTN